MKNNKSLLEKAKETQRPQLIVARHSDEEIELALAWVAGEVTITQVARAKGANTASGVYPFLACALRQWMNEKEK